MVMIAVVIAVSAVVIPIIVVRSESYAAECFACFRGADGCEEAETIETAVIAIRHRQRRVRDAVANFDELVRVGALIAIRADGGGDSVNGDGAIAIMTANDIAAAAGCGTDCRRIVLHVVLDAD